MTAYAHDPDGIHDRHHFAKALTELRERAGFTIRDIAKQVGIPPATAGDYFAGRSLPPARMSGVLAGILRACGITDPSSMHGWQRTLVRVRHATRTNEQSPPVVVLVLVVHKDLRTTPQGE